MFYIRTDANDTIASGHLMRCLSIAHALRQTGEETTFITADSYAKDIIKREGFLQIVMNTKWDNMEDELSVLMLLIEDKHIENMLVDSYQVTTSYLCALCSKIQVIYIDDLADKVYPSDILINYSLTYSADFYQQHYISKATRLVLGARYAPLRQEFWNCSKGEIRKDIADVLITTGGTDPYQMEEMLIEKLATIPRWKNTHFHIVVGPFVSDVDKITKLASFNQNVTLYYDVTSMKEIMDKCDIAIAAAGSTLYELCACGIPTICFAFADNQILGMMGMERGQIMISAGDIRKQDTETIISKLEAGIGIYKEQKVRKCYRDRMNKVTDGRGALRLAQLVIK